MQLHKFGVTRVVTLLTEEQGAFRIRDMVEPLGIAWTWLPIRNGKRPEGEVTARIVAALPILSAHLDAGDAMLIHCSAGIHRTGMVTFALLRCRGYSESDALDLIAQMRATTRDGLHAKHLRFGNVVVAERE